MKTTERFERAVSKLYNAFHKGELNGLDCEMCAVGNMCDNRFEWADVSSVRLNMLKYRGIAKQIIDRTGYSPIELRNIEEIFITGQKHGGIWLTSIEHDRDYQFKGLCAVVEYLCELDGIPNIMDYTSLFETENNEPKKQLEEVFSN